MKRIFHRFRHYPACAVDGIAANLFGLPKLSQPSTALSTASTLSGSLTASHEPDEMRSELGIAFAPTRSSSLHSSLFSSRCHMSHRIVVAVTKDVAVTFVQWLFECDRWSDRSGGG